MFKRAGHKQNIHTGGVGGVQSHNANNADEASGGETGFGPTEGIPNRASGHRSGWGAQIGKFGVVAAAVLAFGFLGAPQEASAQSVSLTSPAGVTELVAPAHGVVKSYSLSEATPLPGNPQVMQIDHGKSVNLAPGQSIEISLLPGRLHNADFTFLDRRPQSEILLNLTKPYKGLPAGNISVTDFFNHVGGNRSAAIREAFAAHALKKYSSSDPNPQIMNPVYMQVEILDASGNVQLSKKKFVDPSVHDVGGWEETDNLWGAISQNGIDIGENWKIRFTPVFKGSPTDSDYPAATRLGEFLFTYHPDNATRVQIPSANIQGSRAAGAWTITLPPELAGKKIAAVVPSWDDDGTAGGVGYVANSNGTQVSGSSGWGIRGDPNMQGAQPMLSREGGPFEFPDGKFMIKGNNVQVRNVWVFVVND